MIKKIESLLQGVAYLSLLGVVLSFLVAKGSFESNTEMCVPRALAEFLLGSFCSVMTWAVLTLLVSISRRLRKLEDNC